MNNKSISWITTLLLPLVAFLLTNASFLMINGVWWDDYTVWNVTPESLYAYLGISDANEVFQYAYISSIVNYFPLENQIFIFHLLAFLFYTISILSMWYILKKITNDKFFTLFSLLLVASFGLDKTKFLIICSHSVVANCLFYLGLALLVKDYYRNNRFLIIIISILWFFSLCVWRTAALLMPLCMLIAGCNSVGLKLKSKDFYIKLLQYEIFHYWPIFVSFISFLVIYKLFLSQNGPHSSYYVPSLFNLIMSPLLAGCSFILSILYYLSSCIGTLSKTSNLPSFILCCTLILFTFIFCIQRFNKPNCDSMMLSFYSAIFLSLSFLLPLSIYGVFRLVRFEEYDTRTLCLASFPVSIIMVSFMQRLNKKAFLFIFSILFVGSFLYSTYSNLDYGLSILKRECIVSYFKNHKQLENQNILVRDMAFSFNANHSALRNYEYEGMARLAYGANTKTAIMSYYGGNQKVFKPKVEMIVSQKDFPIGIPTKLQVFIDLFVFGNEDMKLVYVNRFLEVRHNLIQ